MLRDWRRTIRSGIRAYLGRSGAADAPGVLVSEDPLVRREIALCLASFGYVRASSESELVSALERGTPIFILLETMLEPGLLEVIACCQASRPGLSRDTTAIPAASRNRLILIAAPQDLEST